MRKIVNLLVTLIVLLLFAFPVAGRAQSFDQLLVIDDAQLFGSRIGEVETATAAMAEARAQSLPASTPRPSERRVAA